MSRVEHTQTHHFNWPHVNVLILIGWIYKIIQEHEKSFDENNLRDFIDAFIFEKRKENSSYFTVT